MKLLKRILPLIIALTVVLSFSLVGCGGGSNATQFEVTVTYADGSAVNGLTDGNAGVSADGTSAGTEIRVQFCKIENGELGACSTPATLGADGKYSVNIADLESAFGAGDYEVHLIGVKDGYTYDAKKVVNAKNAKVTLIITEVKSTQFEVTVTYADGSAVNGLTDGNAGVSADGTSAGTEIRVQFCKIGESAACSTPATLGADGKYSVNIADLESASGAGDYEVHLIGVKDGYTYDAKKVVNAKNAKVTLVITEVTE